MGALRSLVLLTIGAAAGAALVIAHRITQETGKPLQEAFAEVPAELEHLYEDLRTMTLEAIEKGRFAWETGQQGSDEHPTESGAVEE